MFWNKYPYTDFHELNLDWVLKKLFEYIEKFNDIQTAWNQFIEDFGDKLDETVKTALQELIDNGELQEIFGAIISAKEDTGGDEPPYPGGVIPVPTVSGKTTDNQVAIIASQNSRAEFFRSVCIASIYSHASGNVSGVYSSRQCNSLAPQTVNVGSEECESKGFQSGNYSAHFSTAEEHSANLSTRYSHADATHAVNVGAVSCEAGLGYGAMFDVVVSDAGEITAVNVLNQGDDYPATVGYTVYDRETLGTGASLTINVVSGHVVSVVVDDGGSGYSKHTDLVVYDPNAAYSMNMAANTCNTNTPHSANIASKSSATSGADGYAVNIAGRDNTASGRSSANIASEVCTASSKTAVCIGSSGSTASGELSVAILANNSEATATGAMVLGRRTINNENRSIAFGDASSGSASTANRKMHMHSNGNLEIAGSLTPNTVFGDYAEMFENAEKEIIPPGTIVELVGDKITAASGSDFIGVISKTACIIACDSPFTWAGRYLIDDFGAPLKDENNDYIENPDYDPEQLNVPRSERPLEWSCVGLIGKVYVRVTADVQPGDYLTAVNGIGHVSKDKTSLKVMKISKTFNPDDGFAIAYCLLK